MGNTNPVELNVASSAIRGKLLGGQNPIVGATISVYTYGTGGYGTGGTRLASTTTDASGNFAFSASAYNCPQNNTPVYLISVGGDSGSGNNPNAVLGAALGACSGAHSAFVVLNEVTTTALAYALGNFFTSTVGPGTGTPDQYDSFGGPSSTAGSTVTYSKGLVQGNSYTAGLLAINSNGLAQVSNNVMTAEPLKVYSIANILATCVNSSGQTSSTDTTSSCGQLFTYTTVPGGARPSDTLQAAVQMALYPTQNVAQLYALPNTRVAFASSLTSQPADWSLAVSYTSSAMGLGVDTNTMSTIDIDSSGRVWFPSNATGKVGVGYYDPANASFFGPYNSTSMVHPEQVAIDSNGYVWVTDDAGSTLSGYNTTAPANFSGLSLPNTKSYSLIVAGDSTLKVGVYDSTAASYKLASVNAGRTSYAESTAVLPSGYLPFSITSDATSNLFFAFSDGNQNLLYDYLASGGTSLTQAVSTKDLPGAVTYNGYDLLGLRAYDGINTNNALCFNGPNTPAGCYIFKETLTNDRPVGAAVDGFGELWVTDNLNATVRLIPFTNYSTHSYLQSVTVGRGSQNEVPTYTYTHNSSNGGTLVNPEGVAIDSEGNVWVSNSGCTTTNCTPGDFVLTEIIGAGGPTITPISAQITSGNKASTEPNY